MPIFCVIYIVSPKSKVVSSWNPACAYLLCHLHCLTQEQGSSILKSRLCLSSVSSTLSHLRARYVPSWNPACAYLLCHLHCLTQEQGTFHLEIPLVFIFCVIYIVSPKSKVVPSVTLVLFTLSQVHSEFRAFYGRVVCGSHSHWNSSITKLAVTRCGNWWCHPIFSLKTDDIFFFSSHRPSTTTFL